MIADKKGIVFYVLLILSIGTTRLAHAEYKEAPAHGIYILPEMLGNIADFFLSRGKMSEQNTRLFEDTARQLRIDYRGIKLRNSGFVLRLFFWLPSLERFTLFNKYMQMALSRFEGYYGTHSYQRFNRVYLNEDWLNQLTDEQKRFVIVHSLTHHSQDHGNIRYLMLWFLGSIVRPLWMSSGFKDQKFIFNVAQMLCVAHLLQTLERHADEQAAELSYCSPIHLAAIVKSVHYPDSTTAPWYAQLQMLAKKAICTITSLPLIKSFVMYRSMEDRAAHVSGSSGVIDLL